MKIGEIWKYKNNVVIELSHSLSMSKESFMAISLIIITKIEFDQRISDERIYYRILALKDEKEVKDSNFCRKEFLKYYEKYADNYFQLEN